MTDPSVSTSTPSRSDSMVRAIMLGLGLGTFLAGAYLAFIGWRTFAYDLDCTLLSPNECALQSEALLFLARRQTIGGVALMAIGLSCFLLLRARQRGAQAAVNDRS